jgi:hypothetical protein
VPVYQIEFATGTAEKNTDDGDLYIDGQCYCQCDDMIKAIDMDWDPDEECLICPSCGEVHCSKRVE